MNSKFLTERGQALILIALAAVGIFAIVGLAIDGGAKFADQRAAQNAADTAALAAAFAKVDALLDVSYSNSPANCPPPSGSMSDASDVCAALYLAGLNRAASNGYDNITNNSVKIYSPPLDGPYAGKGSYVQVVITSDINTTFARVIGIDQTHNTVQAEAFIRDGGDLTDGAMIISYDPKPSCPTGPGNGGGSVDVSGSSSLNLNGGGIFINSSIACGYNAPNCPNINITGGAGISSVAVSPIDNITQKGLPSCVNLPAPEKFNQKSINIPDDIFWPDVPPECSMSGSPTPYKFPTQIVGLDGKLHDQWLIYPGFYSDFPQPTLVSNKSYIYMASGVYCIDTGGKSLSWSTVETAFLNGSTDPVKNPKAAYNPDGVTLYVKGSGGITFNTKSPTYLDASTKGDYQGYLLIVDQGTPTSHPSCTINGGAYIDVNGLIFAPYCNVTVAGGSESYADFNAQIIGWDIKITGDNIITFSYDPSNKVVIKSQIGLMR